MKILRYTKLRLPKMSTRRPDRLRIVRQKLHMICILGRPRFRCLEQRAQIGSKAFHDGNH
jgi:hypothetical protein